MLQSPFAWVRMVMLHRIEVGQTSALQSKSARAMDFGARLEAGRRRARQARRLQQVCESKPARTTHCAKRRAELVQYLIGGALQRRLVLDGVHSKLAKAKP